MINYCLVALSIPHTFKRKELSQYITPHFCINARRVSSWSSCVILYFNALILCFEDIILGDLIGPLIFIEFYNTKFVTRKFRRMQLGNKNCFMTKK